MTRVRKVLMNMDVNEKMELLYYANINGLDIEKDIEPEFEIIFTAIDWFYLHTKKNYDYLFNKARGMLHKICGYHGCKDLVEYPHTNTSLNMN